MAGILPGLLLTVMFFFTIGMTTTLDPTAGPCAERFRFLVKLWSIVVAIGALIFSNFVNIAGFTTAMADILAFYNLSPFQVVLCIVVAYLAMDCVFDSIAMLTLTVPVVALLVPSLMRR
ncbi:hypothetical protein [Pseudosulfitobacter pseudonitzschiae]|uniref:hypothetical protein n=1 Tax=Pseudosulfitobacter pseudonitzschiae TaxID=1402135 RepID=UPI001AF5DF04|nr:hypothetical protein [Pseudosulfitobacter pseudonitzschiae]MBM1817320.1 hypothetical protein [Pseudosulfitobacter pseudonitzschiae]MBM1834331.1 hypothetical protein [Pseudosulfitobacter pseudonitzschiae]MBM1839196.1 hypothetical protein [Pseudosulfitobacter pseudonitzschiae]MBM1844045.1 hypothetical protein [Pseudosulfitobacter pseudonitzschiae]MBM1848881.1 hypothetical protein [Pseudosulfitobacter pseudonitzschiae]